MKFKVDDRVWLWLEDNSKVHGAVTGHDDLGLAEVAWDDGETSAEDDEALGREYAVT